MGLIRHIPNTITLLNLVSGVFGIIYAAKGEIACAFAFMLAAAIFDMLDGAAARGLKAYSAIGKELDSLADLVSFGVLPSFMLFIKMQETFMGPLFVTYIPLLAVPCAALRLARFNTDEKQSHGFKGLPVPAAAMFIGSIATIMELFELGWIHNIMAGSFLAMPIVVYIACRLMLSRLPMVSLKSFSKNSDDRLSCSRGRLITVFTLPIAAGLAVLLAFLGNGFMPALAAGTCAMFTMYIMANTINCMFGFKARKAE